MKGYQLTFYTQQHRKIDNQSETEWLMNEGRDLGISGATVHVAQGGYGRDGKYHSSSLFDVGEQTVEVIMLLSDEQHFQMLSRIKEAGLSIFFSRIPAEFGVIEA